MARKSKQLVREKGILSTPNPKPGQSLPLKSVDVIKAFFESDDISRIMPGKKGFCFSSTGRKTCACPVTTSFEQSEGSIQCIQGPIFE